MSWRKQKNPWYNDGDTVHLGDILGVGVHGRVIEGQNETSGNLLAVKEFIIPVNKRGGKNFPLMDGGDQDNKHILTELHQLHHPNIVELYGMQILPDRVHLFLEYIDGGSMKEHLAKFAPFQTKLIENYGGQIIFGLAYIHSHSFAHRDLKPANLLLRSNNCVKIADFGCAKVIDTIEEWQGFSCTMAGTLCYMAPEVFRLKRFGLSQDIWSLGLIVHEMSTAQPPWREFKVDCAPALYQLICNSLELPSVPQGRPGSLIHFIYQCCLQREPRRRPRSEVLQRHRFFRNRIISLTR